MNRKLRFLSTALVVILVLAGSMRIAADYRAGKGFHPFDTDRALQNNQILFPDSQPSPSSTGEEGDNDDSFWQQEEDGSDSAQAGAQAGFVFAQSPEQSAGTLVESTEPAREDPQDQNQNQDTPAGDPSQPTPTSPGNGNVYEIIDKNDPTMPAQGPDIVVPDNGGNQGNNGNNNGGNGNGSDSGLIKPT